MTNLDRFFKHTHETVKCSCGAIISNCRCWNPDKKVVVRVAGCDECKKKLEDVNAPKG